MDPSLIKKNNNNKKQLLKKKKKLKLVIYKQKNPKETKQKFKLIEAARRQAQWSPCYVAPGTDCSPGSDVVNVVQVQRLIVILK